MFTPKSVVETTPLVVARIRERDRTRASLVVGGRGAR